MKKPTRPQFFLAAIVLVSSIAQQAMCAEKLNKAGYQYHSGSIKIPAASAQEPARDEFSAAAADRYLADGALAWSRERKCVSCHTNGSYLFVRAALTSKLGPPPAEMREFFIAEARELGKREATAIRGTATATASAYIALGLAEWDTHVTKKLSSETSEAIRTMLSVQSKDGSWSNDDCWPPLESSNFHSTALAAMAIASVRQWVEANGEGEVNGQIKRMKSYLRETIPPHDYARVLLLWTETRMSGLIDKTRKEQIKEMIWSRQQKDGGWSLRSFAKPEQWGSGNRAERLKSESVSDKVASDAHMTGLAVLVLRDAGAEASDSRIKSAVQWLKSNQRESGRWWTRSLNTDTYHFITFSSSK